MHIHYPSYSLGREIQLAHTSLVPVALVQVRESNKQADMNMSSASQGIEYKPRAVFGPAQAVVIQADKPQLGLVVADKLVQFELVVADKLESVQVQVLERSADKQVPAFVVVDKLEFVLERVASE